MGQIKNTQQFQKSSKKSENTIDPEKTASTEQKRFRKK